MNPPTPMVASTLISTNEDEDPTQVQASLVPVSRLVPSWRALCFIMLLKPFVKLVCTQTYFASVCCCNVGSHACDLCVHSVRVINKVLYFVENCNDTCCSY